METFLLAVSTILLCFVKLSDSNLKLLNEFCPATQLSGLDYSKTDVTLAGTDVWLRDHKKDLDSLIFVPTSQPKPVGGILNHEMKRAEDIEKLRRSYRKSHITNDIDFELVFHNMIICTV